MVKARLALALARGIARQRGQLLLSIAGVALGVGVVVAVDLANYSARKTFESALQQLAGRATHSVTAASFVDEKFYAALQLAGVRNAAPVVEGIATLRGEKFQLLGIEPFAESAFRGWTPALNANAMRALFGGGDGVWLSARAARRMRIASGDDAHLEIAGRMKKVQVAATLDAIPDGVLLADIATAQNLLDAHGKLSRIDLILDARMRERVESLLPRGARLVTPQTRMRARAELGKPFQTNLAAMSLLALLVGAFLIHNTARFATLRRRTLLAQLRMLGATRMQLFMRMLAEAIALGFAGAAAGLFGGVLLARMLLGLVARTMNDLYFASGAALLLHAHTFWKGLALGVGVTAFAAALPAWQAARARPHVAAQRVSPEFRAQKSLPRMACAGACLLLAAAGFALLPGAALLPGYAALFFSAIGFCLAAPQLARMLLQCCARGVGFSGGYVLRAAAASLSRTAPALSALTLALAAGIGVGVMVHSFRGAVDDWLQRSLPGDLYVSIPYAASARAGETLPAEFVNAVRTLPGVEISMSRRREVETEHGAVTLYAVEFAQTHAPQLAFTQRMRNAWDGFARGEMIFLSQPYAFHHNLRAGDSLEVLTADGMRAFSIGAVYRDYASERGAALLARAAYANAWRDRAVSGIGIYFAPHAHAETVTAQIKTLAAKYDARIRLRANHEIRAQTLRVFEQTFAVTRVLRILVVAVAFAGIFSALLALQLERAREHAVLRACGCTRLRIFALNILQSGALGLLAGILSLPLGWLIAQLLIHVINPRAFGWTLPGMASPLAYAEALALAVCAAALAAVYPGWRMARASPAAALRGE